MVVHRKVEDSLPDYHVSAFLEVADHRLRHFLVLLKRLPAESSALERPFLLKVDAEVGDRKAVFDVLLVEHWVQIRQLPALALRLLPTVASEVVQPHQVGSELVGNQVSLVQLILVGRKRFQPVLSRIYYVFREVNARS